MNSERHAGQLLLSKAQGFIEGYTIYWRETLQVTETLYNGIRFFSTMCVAWYGFQKKLRIDVTRNSPVAYKCRLRRLNGRNVWKMRFKRVQVACIPGLPWCSSGVHHAGFLMPERDICLLAVTEIKPWFLFTS